ncbi:hypothetical protein SLS56_007340 [Neofusicoccum ribis]|uniref:Uncharacterized protein n=1 Tax=Neofusicoccum ribis TaxID=45134 RepID=A0ABR3SNC2_9PEZI
MSSNTLTRTITQEEELELLTIRSFLTHTFYAQGIAREAGDGLGPGGRQLKFRIRSWGEQKQRWTERRMEAFLAGDWD